MDEIEDTYKSISPLHDKLLEVKRENTRYCQVWYFLTWHAAQICLKFYDLRQPSSISYFISTSITINKANLSLFSKQAQILLILWKFQLLIHRKISKYRTRSLWWSQYSQDIEGILKFIIIKYFLWRFYEAAMSFNIFMIPAWKVHRGHLVIGTSVRPSVCPLFRPTYKQSAIFKVWVMIQ